MLQRGENGNLFLSFSNGVYSWNALDVINAWNNDYITLPLFWNWAIQSLVSHLMWRILISLPLLLVMAASE